MGAKYGGPERRKIRTERLEWWRILIVGLGTIMVAVVAWGTMQTNRLVQQEKEDEKRGEQVLAEAFRRFTAIDENVASLNQKVDEEFIDHRKRGEASSRCLAEILGGIHVVPAPSVAEIVRQYGLCVDRVSGGVEPPAGNEED